MWSLQSHGLYPYRFFCPVKNTGVGCHFLFQGIFPIQESNPCLLHCRWIPYHWVTGEAHELYTHIMNHMLISSILLCAFLVLPENFFFTWYVFISSFSSLVIQTKSLKYYRFDSLLIMFIFHLYTLLLLLLLLSHFSHVRLCATP